MNIKGVLENKKVVKCLKQKNLISQYRKAKKYLLASQYLSINFKKRKPKIDEIWSFKINKQYRAFGYFDGEFFIVARISDHQN